MTLKTVKGLISAKVRAAGSLRAAAKDLGVSHSFLADVVSGNRAPGARLLAKFDVEQVVTKKTTYRKVARKGGE